MGEAGGQVESIPVRRTLVANTRVVVDEAVGRGGWIWIYVKTEQKRFSD